jgi:hypothetical protein
MLAAPLALGAALWLARRPRRNEERPPARLWAPLAFVALASAVEAFRRQADAEAWFWEAAGAVLLALGATRLLHLAFLRLRLRVLQRELFRDGR